MQHASGSSSGANGERAQPVRGVPRYHSSPRLQRVHEDGFRGTRTGGGGGEQQQQHIHPEEQAQQHHQSHSHSNNSTRYQHYHHQYHQQQHHQERQQLQQRRLHQHHQQYRSDLHGVVPGQQPGYGNGSGRLSRSRPPLMTSHSESKVPRPGKDGLQGGASSRGGGTDFNQLRSSAEHSMGLKAHAAEFVPGKAGGGVTQRSGKKGVQTLGGAKHGTRANARGTPAGSDLTAFAREFVPGGGGGDRTKSSIDSIGRGHDHDSAAGGEKMVQVVRGGTIYFVPEHEALTTDELVGVEAYGPEEDGFAWAQESTALAAPQRRTMHSTAIPENLWAEFQSQSLSVLRQLPPDDERLKEIPPHFYAAFPLDSASKTRGTAGSFGYPSETYKVIQHNNGHAYALRRFDTVRTTPKMVAMGMEMWLSMPEHPAITRPREAFMHRNALFFLSDFHPGAETLAERFVDKQGGLLSEGLVWRLVSQLLAALRVAHAAGAALRNIHASRVLYCRVGDRVRVNWVGCLDVLEFETRKQVSDLQQQDMVDLGTLILVLSCRHLVTAATRAESISFLAQHYSPELHNLVVSLLTKPPSVFEVCMVTAHRTMDALENTLVANSTLQCHLSNEYDNGRLLRLLLKLGALNERPDQSGGEWAETGERYILKLFRDYCFHQVDTDGEPVLDFGHMYQTLARLDAGDEEKILLTSRDKRSLLVVSFADVKRCLEEAFSEIAGQARASPQNPGVGGNGSGGGSGNGGSEHGGRSVNGLGNHAASESQGGALNGVRSMSMNVDMSMRMGGGMAPVMHGGVTGGGMMGDGVGGIGLVHHGHVPMAHGHHLHGRPIMGVMGHPGPGPPQQHHQQKSHGVSRAMNY